MQKQSLIRTAAIMYADETQAVNIRTIHKKIIEFPFLDNENKELTPHQIIDYVQNKLDLVFSEEEIESIINENKKGEFEVRRDSKTSEWHVKLSQRRLDNLKTKEQKYGIQKYIHEFAEKIYSGNLTNEILESVLIKFIYELLNKNISAFKKITSAKCRAEEISVDNTLFSIEERNAVNDFLNWDSLDKNKAIFSLVSYSVEYSLLSNNIESSSILLQSIRNKIFYLDNNVIYRAIGINGDDRKNRVTTFLRKCIESGQTFVVSKFTANEFRETINHHISQLQKLPFGRINPSLFRKYAIDPSIYELYHTWRRDRTTYGFDLFNGYIQGLYTDFIENFKIEVDYKIPYNEKDEKVLEVIGNYTQEIRFYKGKGSYDSHKFDAQNTYLVEQRRGNNNISITDTKYYLVSTDQKLRNWDFARTDSQPIALLPTQWMTILLKYFSRTDDDFKSFVSFLKLNQVEPIIQSDKLQIILSGISEITEDFERQSAILERMVEVKFDGILDGKNIEDIREKASEFSKALYDKEIATLKTNYSSEMNYIKDAHDKTAKQKMLDFKKALLSEVNESLTSLQNIQVPINKLIKEKVKNNKWKLVVICVIFYSIICLLIYMFDWNTMEPITFCLGIGVPLISYIYMVIVGESFEPKKFLELQEKEIMEQIYKDFDFDIERLNTLNQRKIELEEEIEKLK